jgi:hypothetical protein
MVYNGKSANNIDDLVVATFRKPPKVSNWFFIDGLYIWIIRGSPISGNSETPIWDEDLS